MREPQASEVHWHTLGRFEEAPVGFELLVCLAIEGTEIGGSDL